MDDFAADFNVRRQSLARKLAVIDAAEDPDVADASDDFEARANDDDPYEDAAPADQVLSDAFKRYVR